SAVNALSNCSSPDHPPVQAFRWDQLSNQMTPLGYFDANRPFSGAFGCSADGSVVVGTSLLPAPIVGCDFGAFRYASPGGMADIDPPGNNQQVAEGYACSVFGNVVVGRRDFSAFRWASPGPMQFPFTSNLYYTQALGVSQNGSVMVGEYDYQAFRWTSG